MRRVVGAVLVVLTAVPLATAGAAREGEECGAITVRERPKLGDRTRGFDWDPYIRVSNRYLRRHPDVYASGYLAGKHMYVGFTDDVCRRLRHMRGQVEQRWRLRAFVAGYSYAELERANACVGELAGRRRLAITGWGPDVYRNRLMVMLRKRTERRERVIRRECRQAAIYFREGEVSTD